MQERPSRKASGGKTTQAPADHVHVFAERDWKEYLGESLLIVFSVMLALFATEFINERHERKNTRSMLNGIIAELQHNRTAITDMQAYDLTVLTRIDSMMNDPDVSATIVSRDAFHLELIAPQGVLYRYMDDDAWSVAKNSNILSKMDVGTATLLTRVYDDQIRIGKVEDEVARIILNRESRDPAKAHQTLALIRDVYHGWAVDRTPALLPRMDSAINLVSKELH